MKRGTVEPKLECRECKGTGMGDCAAEDCPVCAGSGVRLSYQRRNSYESLLPELRLAPKPGRPPYFLREGSFLGFPFHNEGLRQ